MLSASGSLEDRTPEAEHLRAISDALHFAVRNELETAPVLSNWQALIDYLMLTMARLPTEQMRVLFLNSRNRLLADEAMGAGTIDAATIYPREIIKRALQVGATALILAHNHPSGDPKPSYSDIQVTRLLIEAARPLNIIVHDHVIVARSGWMSMRTEGMI